MLPVFRILLFSALLGLNLPALAQVYKSTDADGNIVYSDQPGADSEEVKVPDPNVGDAVKVPETAPEPQPEPEIVADEAPSNLDGELVGEEREKEKSRRRRPKHF